MWFLKVPVLFFLVSIFISFVGHADAVSVVFGSFQNRDAAETQRIHIQKLVSVTLDIVQVEIEGNEYHRLVSPSFSSSEAEILASDARSRGLSVWYLRDVQPVAQDSRDVVFECTGTIFPSKHFYLICWACGRRIRCVWEFPEP